MKTRALAIALAALAALALCSAGVLAAADVPFNNAILVYADPGRDWAPGSFDYYLAYINKDGTPRDWLFDGFLFLAISSPSHRGFWDGKADASDWDWWLDNLFAKGKQFDALELDTQALEAKLGPTTQRKVIISVPRPPIDADSAGQWAIVKSFVDRAVQRFAEKGYRKIALDGFYWFHEGVDGTNADVVNRLWQDLNPRGLRLYWIPYDVDHGNREHLKKWQAGEIKFDELWLQPNYFWAERNAKYAAQDLDDTVSFARSVGAAVEIEFDRGAYTTGWKLGRFTHYLMSADVYGYRNGPLTYYDGYQGYIKCGQSKDPVQRSIYDDIYWFCKKAYLPKPMIYPGVFFDKGGEEDPAAKPQIGLWLAKGDSGQIYFVEPDPNKDYLVILKSARRGGGIGGGLEALIEGAWVRLEATKGDGDGEPGRASAGEAARLERFRLPRALIQKVWKPTAATGGSRRAAAPPLVLELRRTGAGRIEAAWARPDDFVFRYLEGKEPMETELRLDRDEQAATLRNVFGETMVGLRTSAGGKPGAGLTISDGPSRTKKIPLRPDSASHALWIRGKPDGSGNLTIRLDPGVKIIELWAWPADAILHLRPGSCGDTRADLHVPGASLVPDGKWKLAGEFGRNYRQGEAGAGVRVDVPGIGGAWNLVLLVDTEPAASVDIRALGQGGVVKKIEPGAERRIVIPLKAGEHILTFGGPVTLHDAWLEQSSK